MAINSKLKDFKIITGTEFISYSVETEEKDGIEYIRIKLNAKESIVFPKIRIEFKYPLKGVSSYWNPGSARRKGFEGQKGA